MKPGIHPELKEAKVICAGCGNEFKTLSVREAINVGICSNCHPFFTGTNRLVDTEGRIDKFNKRYKLSEDKRKEQGEKQEQKKEKKKGQNKKKVF